MWSGSHDALFCPGKRHICVIVHPIRAETELEGGLGDAGPETLLGVVKPERAVLGHEGAVDVVDILGALAVGERGVEDHDGASVHDEADLAPEGAVQPLGEIGEHLREHLSRQRNGVHGFQSRGDVECRRRRMCRRYPHCWLRHRHRHWRRHGHMMYHGHEGGWNRLPGGYGYGLGEDVGGHLALQAGSGMRMVRGS